MSTRAGAVAIAFAFSASIVSAQATGAIRGRVVDGDSRPVVGAQITLSPGARHVVSDENGALIFSSLTSGGYTLAAKRIGYNTASVTATVRDSSTAQPTITLVAIPRQLDSVRVREKKSGFSYGAVVLDLNDKPVVGAEVTAMGVTGTLTTDSLGRFTVSKLSQGTLAVHLRKMGYQATLSSFRMLADRSDTLRMPRLAQTLSAVEVKDRSGFGNDETAYQELAQRTRWKGSMAGTVSREELDALGGANLCDALYSAPTAGRLGLHPYKGCSTVLRKVLVDGKWCQQRPLSDYIASEVEMVEIYFPPLTKKSTMDSDPSHTLASRECAPVNPEVAADAEAAAEARMGPSHRAGGVNQPRNDGRSSDITVAATLVMWMRKKENDIKAIVPKPRTIVGIVFDSIAQRPLGGAHVMLEDVKRETVADSLGAFRFDSIPSGVHELKADHETLGLIGWPSLRDTVDLVPELITNVTLAIPSFATLWKHVCDDSVPPRPAEGLVYGRVLLGAAAVASSDTSGTVVEASWRGANPDSALDAQSSRQVPADSAGNYAVCGAPTTQPLTISSLSHGTATVSVSFTIGYVRIARRDLILPAADIIDRLVADSTGVAPLGAGEGSTITGVVRDSLGKPINDAHVAVTGLTGEWRTNERGRFIVRGIPGGARVVTSSQLGFAPERRLVDVSGADSLAVDLSMSRVSTYLDTLKISGTQSPRTSTLLDIASRRKLGLGYAADSTALAKTPGPDLRAAFNFPSVRASLPPPPAPGPSGRAGSQGVDVGIWRIYMTDHAASLGGGLGGPGCQPSIFLDGTPSNINTLNDMSKDEVGLIEVFTSASRAPTEYAGSGGNCGVVLVWRKRYLKP